MRYPRVRAGDPWRPGQLVVAPAQAGIHVDLL